MTKKFEYCRINVSLIGTDAASKELDDLGNKGWELVFIVGNTLFLKREMTEAEKPKYEYTHVSVNEMYAPEEHTKVLTECGANGWRVMSTKTRVVDRTTKMIDYLLERPADALPFGMSSDEINDVLHEPNPPKGFVGHNPEPIPPGIYFRSGNFYDACNGNKGMGIPFYDKWCDKATEFPTNATDAIIAHYNNLSDVSAKGRASADIVFDYSYFFSPEHVWIKGNKIAIMSFINQCWNRNVWFNYYPNVSNKEFPWLIIKSGMKNEIVAHAERYGMCIEVIPGQHMTEDKL